MTRKKVPRATSSTVSLILFLKYLSCYVLRTLVDAAHKVIDVNHMATLLSVEYPLVGSSKDLGSDIWKHIKSLIGMVSFV